MRNIIDNFFNPKTVAVVGASNNKNKIGAYIFFNLKKRFNNRVYPINIKNRRVQGTQAYSTVMDIKAKLDLVIIATPAKTVLPIVEECVKAGAKNIIIISAGFKEVNDEGRFQEERLQALIKKHKLNVIGPNCLGIINASKNFNFSFAKDVPQSGNISCISQSGAIIDALLDWSFKANIGFAKIFSLGNMAGIDEIAALRYLQKDQTTEAIVMYMETMHNGRKFGQVLAETARKKPVIILKPGVSTAAQKAIGSHTGSLAKNSELVKTIIKDNNGIFVSSIDELQNVLIGLKAKQAKNNSLLILTNAGGPGVIATDILRNTDFSLYKLKDKEKDSLNFLPLASAKNNPVDILGDARSDRYQKTLRVLDKIKDLGNIFIMLTPQMNTDNLNIAKKIFNIAKQSNKTIFSCFLGSRRIKPAVEFFNENNFANFSTPKQALTAMNALNQYYSFRREKEQPLKYKQDTVKRLNKEISKQRGLLSYNLTASILKSLGIKIYPKQVISSLADIRKIKLAKNLSYVLKVDSNIIHKKKSGALLMDINKNNFVGQAIKMFNKFGKNKNSFALTLEKEVRGQQLIIGLKRDEDLDNFLMFGAGGSLVEIIKDTNWSTCPVGNGKAKELVKNSAVYSLLKNNKVNLNKVYNLIHQASYLLELFPDIKEVDFNPIICDKNNIYLVDVKLIV